ncbi:MAG: Mur ligase domain-containing protein [Lentisphaeria bacterium]
MLKLPWRHLYFSGCGGVGMAGLAQITADCGVQVSGSDVVDSAMLAVLQRRGCQVTVGQTGKLPENIDLLIYSAAVPPGNPERLEADRRRISSCSRGAFLAQLATFFPRVIALAGSHGKTTTTAMLTHLAKTAGLEPGFLVGGIVEGWERSAAAGRGEVLITEVDESDGTQALLSASLAIILNIDDDHCWSFGGVPALEQCFRTFAENAAKVLTWNTPATQRVLGSLSQCHFLDYEIADTVHDLSLPGLHNRQNAAIALQAARELGIDNEQAVKSLSFFSGVSRRLSLRWRSPDGRKVLVEDYAHHPTELQASLQALREKWPRHTLMVLFQPHRFERVKRYSSEFARILSSADRVWVAAPFAAWQEDAAIANPREIVSKINSQHPGLAEYLTSDPAEICPVLCPVLASQDAVLLAVIGAGDIGKAVQPLADLWQQM